MKDRAWDRRAARRLGMGLVVALAASLGAQGCSDDGNDASGNGGNGASGSGGSGASGSGGEGGGGGSGGSSAGCLPSSAYADRFEIKDPAFCVVALYDVDALDSTPTWGRHGGLLTTSPGVAAGSVKLTRLSPPPGTTGKMTEASSEIDAQLPAKTFLGGQALDLPFFGWTAVSYTGSFPDTKGELILIDSNAVAARYPVNGFYAGAAVGEEGSLGRLLYTGLSPLGDAAAGANAVYAADACGAQGKMPRLLPEGDASCGAPLEVASWAEASGPVAVDRQGNAFAVLSSFSTSDQEARGFAADQIARGKGAVEGTSLFKLPGYSGSLGAIAPAGDETGRLFFQPIVYDAASMASKPGDVVVQGYTVAAGAVQADGEPKPFLAIGDKGIDLPFCLDDKDRLWVASQPKDGSLKVAVVARVP